MPGDLTRNNESLSVVLFQLGGPDSLEAIEPFLYNLFSDPDIIDLPFARLAREPLARLIASKRSRRVRKHYEEIGGRSPIRDLTERQAAALERELSKSFPARVFVAMRYWHPLTAEAVSRVLAQSPREVVLLPLYPQYSRTTTGSSLNEWHRKFPRQFAGELKVIRDFHDHPGYVDAVAQRIDESLEKFRRSNGSTSHLPSDVHLLFSAHSIPRSIVEAGDPYRTQIETTVKLVVERGRWSNPHTLCYQSRSGPGVWLQPFLPEALGDLAGRGVERVLVVPISFVSDHVETLHEINVQARELAERLGIRQFETMPGLNDSPKFISALADVVLRSVGASVPA